MALLFMEGFDQYLNHGDFHDSGKWDFIASDDTYNSITAEGEGYGGVGKAVFTSGSLASYGPVKSLDTTDDTLCLHFAMKYDSTSSTHGRFYIQEKSSNLTMFYLSQPAAGTMRLNNGDDTQIGTDVVIGVGVWFYVQLKIKFHDTTGTVLLKINGVEELNLTNVDTVDNSNTVPYVPGSFSLTQGSSSGAHNTYYDDIFICDTLGTSNNDLMGEVKVGALFPDGDSSVQFSRLSGTTNYEMVNAPSNGLDTSYNYSTTAGHKDLFTFEDMPSSTGVLGVSIGVYGKKKDAGSRHLKLHCNTGANTNETAAFDQFGWEYRHIAYNFEFQTGTTDWTESAVNAIVAGYELDA